MQEGKAKSSPRQSSAAALCFGSLANYVIHSMPLGAVAFNHDLTIIESNPRARALLASAENVAEALGAGVPNDQIDWPKELRYALEHHESCVFDNVSYSHNDRHYVLHITCTILGEQNPELAGFGILLIDDVTAKVTMQNNLAHAERLAAVGKLAAKVAHELNNPLDGILRYINLAARVAEQQQHTQIDGYLKESRKGLMRMTRIVSELLEFSRSSHSAAEEADINKIVEEAIRLMHGAATENGITISRQFSHEMPNIRSGNLFQVFTNLIKNAIDATPQGGELLITTRCNDLDAFIVFADSGTGIKQEVFEKIFEPFFTTKPPGQGTGLGLAICKDIVERYNGTITVENRPSSGSLFTVRLPLEAATLQ